MPEIRFIRSSARASASVASGPMVERVDPVASLLVAALIIVEALRRKGLPFAYLPFEGEQHGFRKAESIIRAEEAELYFYGRVWGFAPADEIEPVKIENLD